MKKLSLKELFNNDRFLWLFSLLFAIVVWFVVINAVDPSTRTVIKGVPVTLNITDSALGKLGLDNVNNKMQTVDVTITGERYIVASVRPEDIQVTAVLTGITNPGMYDLRLIGTDRNGKGFEVADISPAVIQVQFDRMVTKKLPVQVDISGVSFPEGYTLERETVTPAEVSVTGPEAEMSKVYRCVAKAEINRTLTQTEVIKSKVELQDKDGNVLQSSLITMDTTTVDITIPVLRIKNIPLKVEFLNVPDGFPLEELRYTLSEETVAVAGPTDSIGNLGEITLGYIDMRDLDTQGSYTFDIVLPSGYVNVDGVSAVEVTFDGENITSKTFTVTDIRVVNRPANYDVAVSTRSIANVRVFGPKTVLESMTGSDLIAQIDLTDREIRPGQTKITVDIVAPTKGLVWANGTYQVQVNITAK